MKNKFSLIAILVLLYTSSLNAQINGELIDLVDYRFECKTKNCTSSTGNEITDNRNSFVSMFSIDIPNQRFLVRRNWGYSARWRDAFLDMAGYKLVPSLNVCAPFTGSSIQFGLKCFLNRASMKKAKYTIMGFSIVDVTDNANHVVVYFSPTTVTNDGMYYSFVPSANRTYMISAAVHYEIKNAVGYKLKDEAQHVYFYYCVGNIGGDCSKLVPLVETNNLSCSGGSIGFNTSSPLFKNIDTKFKYYFSESTNPNSFVLDEYHEVGNPKAIITKPGIYYVIAADKATNSKGLFCTGNSIEVKLLGVPGPPLFTPVTYCPCSLQTVQLNAQLGTNANSIEWCTIDQNNNASVVGTGTSFNYLSTNTFDVYVRSKNTCFGQLVKYDINRYLCGDCIHPFAPEPGKYVLTGWVKQSGTQLTTYQYPYIEVVVPGGSSPINQKFYASGPIIDGWQRVEATFTISAGSTAIEMSLGNESNSYDVYFDDIRLQPFNSNMTTYVYDQQQMRLVAQLDNQNFYTQYIYDDEGNLLKLNVETIEGVRTQGEMKSHTVRK